MVSRRIQQHAQRIGVPQHVVAAAETRVAEERRASRAAMRERHLLCLPGLDPRTEGTGSVQGDEAREVAISQQGCKQIYTLTDLRDEALQQMLAARQQGQEPVNPIHLAVGEEQFAAGLERGLSLARTNHVANMAECDAVPPAGSHEAREADEEATQLDYPTKELLLAAARSPERIRDRILAFVSHGQLAAHLPARALAVFVNAFDALRQREAIGSEALEDPLRELVPTMSRSQQCAFTQVQHRLCADADVMAEALRAQLELLQAPEVSLNVN